MEDFIDLMSLFKHFRKNKRIIMYIVLGVFVLSNVIFFIKSEFLYSSFGTIKISTEATENTIVSYKDFLLSDIIIDNAIKKSNVEANKDVVRANISLNANVGSNIYKVILNYKNKEDGNKLCKSIIDEFIKSIDSYDESYAVIYDNVVTTDKPININILKNEIVFFVLGIVCSLGYLFVIYCLNKNIKSESELYNFNILGRILNKENDKYENNLSLIKTKIKLANLGNVIFLNTPRDIECKDDVVELVKEFSKDSKVLFIDTNIRNNKSKKIGYSDLLKKYNSNYANYIKFDKYDSIDFGTINNEVEVLLSSKNNERIINDLKKQYDYIILYNANAVDFSDSLIISKLCDYNYVIVGINQTNKQDLEKTFESYKQINSEVNGIIIIDK